MFWVFLFFIYLIFFFVTQQPKQTKKILQSRHIYKHQTYFRWLFFSLCLMYQILVLHKRMVTLTIKGVWHSTNYEALEIHAVLCL